MTLDDLLDGLFLQRPNITREGGVLTGQATLKGGGAVEIVGVYDATPLGVDEAIRLSRHVLDALMRGSDDPIFVFVDSGSQRMSKRDELLGVNEFLGHLAKCLIWADMRGRRTLGVLYAWFPRLLNATPAQREAVEIGRFGLHWEDIDEDISVAGLLAGRRDQTVKPPAAPMKGRKRA